MTPQLEKVFFAYIMKHKKYFHIVKTYFFRNSEIQFVYGVVQKYILESIDSIVPSPRQILDMVAIEDKEGLITKEILKAILQVKLTDYSEKDFILPRFNGWILSNRLKTGTVDVIDETRDLENISDFGQAVEAANRIRAIVDEMSSTKFVEDDDLGSDFDDPENHVQDSSKFKVTCGFPTIDHLLGGGWDIATLNVIMAQTNAGKCTFCGTGISLRNKRTGCHTETKIDRLFAEIRKGHTDI